MYICSMIKKWILIVLAAAAFTLAADPVTVEARLTEIPGKMPSNDLYSYVYVFKIGRASCRERVSVAV